MKFKDHFSGHAAQYAKYRPAYPAELSDFLAAACPDRELAWDCGAGNGQFAVDLARVFAKVYATDASSEQIANAIGPANVVYSVAPAERSGLPSQCADLITVAQALHWFDIDAFMQEARRVLKQGGIMAAWCYELFTCEPAVDAIVRHFFTEVVGPFWPPERALVEQHYRNIAFPFEEIASEPFAMQAVWNLTDLIGYMNTWSATKRYREAKGSDPVPELMRSLEEAWGSPAAQRPIHWPLHLRVGRQLES